MIMNNTHNKVLIIPDLHGRIEIVESIIQKEPADKIILLGDEFDDFGDTERDAEKTALWLKESIYKPNRIHILGNHTCHYFFSGLHTRCSGFTEAKARVIKSIISQKDIENLVFHYWEQNYLITHAGLSNRLIKKVHAPLSFLDQKVKAIKEYLIKEEELAQLAIRSEKSHWFYGAGRARGGRQEIGGLTWCDWNHEFVPIPYFGSICGHTEGPKVRIKESGNYKNYCLDTKLKYYGILSEGEIIIKKS